MAVRAAVTLPTKILAGLILQRPTLLQVEATGENVPAAITSFDDANLPPALAANTKRCNYSKPTPVQKYSIPIGLAHRDLMACAQTGSGKTAAFCFPVRRHASSLMGMEPSIVSWGKPAWQPVHGSRSCAAGSIIQCGQCLLPQECFGAKEIWHARRLSQTSWCRTHSPQGAAARRTHWRWC